MTFVFLYFLPCVKPRNLAPVIKLSTIARVATGRCGHPIATRHKLFAGPNGPEIFDTVAAKDRGRNPKGARPLGLLGFFTKRSIHRCDLCTRRDELEHTIVCTVCGSSIAPGASVDLIPSNLVYRASHERYRDLATVTDDRASTVVCAGCTVGHFNHHAATLRWTGGGVMDEHDLMKVRAYLATQAA